MASYKIQWKESALKELQSIPKKYIPKIINEVESLSSNPFPPGNKKLSGSEKTYRLRVGIYRITYEVDKAQLIVQIIQVKHRKDAYK